jgi:[protein-PII] uridylyltransferase
VTHAERQRRADAADATCSAAFACAAPDPAVSGVALVAVGGYGRRELAPHSDLDVVLVHEDDVDVTGVAEKLWYPLWDEGYDVDHAVRALTEVTAAAKEDLRVALGLVDVRHLAGDPALTLRLRTSVLAEWRRDARERLPRLRELVGRRGDRTGELAHATVPDLKESTGGLRDATVLNALVATWLVDVPHTDLERSRRQLLDVRDALHEVAGRATDRVAPELWDELAGRLGLADAEAAHRHVRELGRRITHLARLTWRRVDAVLARPAGGVQRRRPALEPIAPGLAVSGGEVVLDSRARPGDDPLLLIRAASEAAERRLILAPATAARLARRSRDVPQPWPEEARNRFVRLLVAGPGLLPVWETLDETGALPRLLPEWERVRLLPHASVVHRFTVDRHLVETCIEASGLIRRVARPDVLAVAALLHDIGKSDLREHSVAGAPVAAVVAARMGFAPAEVELVRGLVRHHLLLARVATTRDLEDPQTVAFVADQVADVALLDLLAVLTEADARATSPQAWTPWRAGLVRTLVERVRPELLRREGGEPDRAAPELPDGDREVTVPDEVRRDPGRVSVQVLRTEHGTRVVVVSGDRVGLLAAATATFALQRLSVRAARAWTQNERFAVSVWDLDDGWPDAAVLRERMTAILDGRVDVTARMRRLGASALTPSVAVHPDASRRATVLEVRVEDRPGVVHLVCGALAGLDLTVRSAHVTTFGPQAVDVFYVQEQGAGGLSDERAAAAAHAVRDALEDTVTLEA